MARDGFEKIIKVMRDQVESQFVPPFTFGTMKEDGKIDVGEVELDADMYYRLDGLLHDAPIHVTGWETDAEFTVEEFSLQGTLTVQGSSNTAQFVGEGDTIKGKIKVEEYDTEAHWIIEPGDTVLMCRLSEEQFMLLGKVEA